MLIRNILLSSIQFARHFSLSTKTNFKVTIVGSSNGLGKTVAFLLRQCCLATQLCLFDQSITKGLSVDLSHINTKTEVEGFEGDCELEEALHSAKIIVITAGQTRKLGLSESDLFCINARILMKIIKSITCASADALIVIATEPVNSLVPVACETLKRQGVCNLNKVFGVTTINSVRANTIVGELKDLDPKEVNVTVVGGNSKDTIVPLFSRLWCTPLTDEEMELVLERMRNSEPEVLKASHGKSVGTLTLGYSVVKFVGSLLRGLSGEPQVYDVAYMRSDKGYAKYFASPILLGECGLEDVQCIRKLSCFEEKLLERAVRVLEEDIEIGEEFIKSVYADPVCC